LIPPGLLKAYAFFTVFDIKRYGGRSAFVR
jgi:hypothetical protein